MGVSLAATLRTQWVSSTLSGYVLLFGITLIALVLRLHSFSFIPESLWNEDAIFINQARELGVSSLWTPFPGGYHFLYHRLVALFADQLPLVYAPYIFFLGWLLSFLLIVWIVIERARLIGIDRVVIVLVVMGLVFQPSHGEAWFNLNQAHFTTGAALSFYLCMPAQRAPTKSEAAFLLITSLSGITSVLMVPILLLQLLILRDFRTRGAVYAIVFSSACVEAALTLFSERLAATATNMNPVAWANATEAFLFFGAESRIVYILGAAFWVITVIGLIQWMIGKDRHDNIPLWLSPICALLAAWIMFVASGRAMDEWLPFMSPLDMASRYFIIPYALIFFTSLVVNGHDWKRLLPVAATIALICALTFRTVDRPDRHSSTGLLEHSKLQWGAFARLHGVRPDIAIPINANWPTYPPIWMVTTNSASGSVRERAPVEEGIRIDRHSVGVPKPRGEAAWTLSTDGESPTLEIRLDHTCADSSYLGIEVAIWRSRMGWAELRWGDGHQREGGGDNSLRRFYPAGSVQMHFATHRRPSDNLLILRPAAGVADSAMVRELNRLAGFSSTLVVAKPTEPGGDVRIESVRLFCLGD